MVWFLFLYINFISLILKSKYVHNKSERFKIYTLLNNLEYTMEKQHVYAISDCIVYWHRIIMSSICVRRGVPAHPLSNRLLSFLYYSQCVCCCRWCMCKPIFFDKIGTFFAYHYCRCIRITTTYRWH